jgi:virulence-associated protein VagC
VSAKHAKVFWSGRSQAIRLPKEFRFESETVLIRREGESVILESVDAWPVNYVASFTGADASFKRPKRGVIEEREPFP